MPDQPADPLHYEMKIPPEPRPKDEEESNAPAARPQDKAQGGGNENADKTASRTGRE